MLNVFDIISLNEKGFPYFNWLENFSVGPAKKIEVDDILEEGWTLFGFDFENRVAVFLDVGANSDLSVAPFIYDEQLKLAKRITVVSLEQFISIANEVSLSRELVQIYNIGHCGSTLLHNVFNKVPHVKCLSEPKAFFDLAFCRHDLDRDFIQQLAKCAMKFVCMFPMGSQSGVLVIKHFSQVNAIFAPMHEAAPQARNLFLYRDGNSWSNSFFGFAQRGADVRMEIPRDRRVFQWRAMSGNASINELDGLVDMNAEHVTFDSFVAIAWALHIRDYLKAYEANMPFFAIRYNELSAHRDSAIKLILEHCGLNPDFAELTLGAFDQDSHKGTKTSRDIPVQKFSEDNYHRLAEIFSNPRINIDPDITLPSVEK